jgi:hypothetical protein
MVKGVWADKKPVIPRERKAKRIHWDVNFLMPQVYQKEGAMESNRGSTPGFHRKTRHFK